MKFKNILYIHPVLQNNLSKHLLLNRYNITITCTKRQSQIQIQNIFLKREENDDLK